MSSRNAIAAYDPQLAQRHSQLGGADMSYGAAPPPPQYSERELREILRNDVHYQKKQRAAELEREKDLKRQEERRRRDPTYKDDALDFKEKPKAFDVYFDYYAVLAVDEFASQAEIRKQFLALSQQSHPDKLATRPEDEQKRGIEAFQTLTDANEVLSHPPTRLAYDRARNKGSAKADADLPDFNAPKWTQRPPPNCVDVEVSLHQLFRGCHKKCIFHRKTWDSAKEDYNKSEEHFTMRLPKGTLEGSTFRFERAGDRLKEYIGRCDLFFVIRMAPHSRFERVGHDLWLRISEPTPAEALLFCTVVTSIDAKPALAVGFTLHHALGFDRSGVGETVVTGYGMPLPKACLPPDGSGPARGDLIVKFAVSPPTRPRKVHLVCGRVLVPPVLLCTSSSMRPPHAPLPVEALRLAVHFTVLPAVLALVHARQEWRREQALAEWRAARGCEWLATWFPGLITRESMEADEAMAAQDMAKNQRHPSPVEELTGVVLFVGGDASPMRIHGAAAAFQVQAAVACCLPQMLWRNVHATRGVAEPLLADEETSLSKAAVLILVGISDFDDPGLGQSTTGGKDDGGGDKADDYGDGDEEFDLDASERTQRDRAYLSPSSKASMHALAAMPSVAEAIRACHCGGGVVIALDDACTLLDTRHSMVQLSGRGRSPLLPFLVGGIGLRPGSWLRLRSAAAVTNRVATDRARDELAALGLRLGSVVTIDTAKPGCLVRQVLGSSAPLRVSRLQLREWSEQREARHRGRAVERERLEILAYIRTLEPRTQPRLEEQRKEPIRLCERCNSCPGYRRPQLPAFTSMQAPGRMHGATVNVAICCAECGCRASDHCPVKGQDQRM